MTRQVIIRQADGRVLGFTEEPGVAGCDLIAPPANWPAPGHRAFDFVWDGDDMVLDPLPPDLDLAPLRNDRKAALAARRWEAEIGGITFAGMPILTDERSQAKIMGAALAATLDSNYAVRWKTSAGFVTLDAMTVLALAQAVRAHIQACFDREAEIVMDIDAASTPHDLAAIDIAEW